MIHDTQTVQISQKQDGRNGHIVFMITYILRPSSFCEIWALCVSWITYDHLYYTNCLACWALFGLLVPAVCDRTSCAQVHELPQSHCGDNRGGTLCSWLHIYYAHVAFVRFEHSVCRHLWRLIYKYIYIYTKIITNKEKHIYCLLYVKHI